MATQKVKTALVHNWLSVRGGSERVLFQLHDIFPEAPIYTLVFRSALFPELKDTIVKTSWLQRIPGLRSHHELFPPLRYFIWRNTWIRGYDLVLSSSSSENKAVRVPSSTLHIAYIHTPPHYYWRYFDDYLRHPGFGLLDPVARIGLRILNPLLRRLDRRAAQNPDVLLANSKFIQSQIKQYYGRSSIVLYPGVDTERFGGGKADKQDYFLVFGRQTIFKHIDLIIKAFNELELPLIVAGDGPEHDRLVAVAGPTISFRVSPRDEQLAKLVRGARAAVFANEEDFGITWVESMAAGTPVICYGSGGALETVLDKKTGVLFDEQSVDAIKASVAEAQEIKWDYRLIKKQADRFSMKAFEDNLAAIIEKATADFRSKP